MGRFAADWIDGKEIPRIMVATTTLVDSPAAAAAFEATTPSSPATFADRSEVRELLPAARQRQLRVPAHLLEPGLRAAMIRTPADGSRRPGLALVGVCLFAAFSVGYGNFLGSDNLNAIALSSAFVLIASIGTMALLVSGNVDLSIGSQYALISVVTALVVLHTGSALLGVVAGAVARSRPGRWSTACWSWCSEVSPLIVTLATLGIYGGLAYVAGAGNTVFGLPGSFTVIGSATVLGVPVPVIVAVCAFLAGAWVLVATITGVAPLRGRRQPRRRRRSSASAPTASSPERSRPTER
jgi:hypothetical protein